MFYNPFYSIYDNSLENWGIIGRLAILWGFDDVHALVTREVSEIEDPLLMKKWVDELMVEDPQEEAMHRHEEDSHGV